MVDELAGRGAKAVGFDIIFAEQSLRAELDSRQLGELRALSVNADVPEIRDELTERLEGLRPESSDRLFASAIEKAGNVFLPSVFYADAQDVLRNPGVEASADGATKILSALSRSSLRPPAGAARLKAFFNATVPFQELAAASAGIGHINLFPDSDGTARRFLPAAVFDDKAYISFPLRIAAFAMGVPFDEIKVSEDSVSIGEAVIPLLSDGSAFIPYQGGRTVKQGREGDAYEPFYRYIPYHDLLASKDLHESGREPLLPDDAFKDKIVLVTIAAAGLSDLRATPFSPVSPGVEIHANIIDAALSRKSLKTINPTLEGIYMLLLALAIALIARFTGPFGAFAVAGIGASVSGMHWAYFGRGLILPVVGPLVAMALTYLSVLLLKYSVERREKSYIKKAFGHYIAPAVLEKILKSPESLRLSGERRYMTVLFCDIEGFTTLSGTLPPEDVGHMLNDHMNRMVECVQRTGGTVDKFIGDNVMAMWNAPAQQENHSERACETALFMMDALKNRGEWMEDRGIFLNIRVGVNTGEMVVGNMGSKEIFDYTVIGNEVNLCSRLEAVNKEFGTRIAVSESAYKEVKRSHPDKFVFRRMARILLKGSAAPLNVYELAGWQGSIDNDRLEAMEKYELGFSLFMERRLSEAERLFREAMEKDDSDTLSKKYLSLIAHYKENPLPPDWDGTYVQRTK